MKQIFTNFDKSKDGKLNIQEFTKLVLVIDKKLPVEEIKAIFTLFNTDGDTEISFEEFSAMLAYWTNENLFFFVILLKKYYFLEINKEKIFLF